MTYFLRGAILSLGTFFLIYVSLSLGVMCAWQIIRKREAALSSSLLYGLRVSPLLAAAALVMFIVIPSFVFLEPHGAEEWVRIPALALACGGIVVAGWGTISALWASWKTSRYVASCSRTRAVQLEESGTRTIQVNTASPVLLVAGIYHPKLLISEQARQLLNEGERQAAIRHELAHVRFRDNLKKLVLRLCWFPRLDSLDRSWMEAAEMAADDAAATDESTAVDLASALLKVASQSSAAPVPDLAMTLVRDKDHALRARIERLLNWEPRASSADREHPSMPLVMSCLVLLAVTYGPLLHQVHELTELLTR